VGNPDGPYDYAWERWDAERAAWRLPPDPRDEKPDPAEYMDLEPS
jgi:hypothetical protein